MKVNELTTGSIEEFERFLKDNVVSWKDRPTPNMGVKALEFDGYFIRNSLASNTVMSFWKQVNRLLPEDAVICRPSSDTPIVLQGVSPAGYTDSYVVILASAEWSEIPENATIPRLVVKGEGDVVTELVDAGGGEG